jgi:pimeloyl-ACP methyl ester carboxylesterase
MRRGCAGRARVLVLVAACAAALWPPGGRALDLGAGHLEAAVGEDVLEIFTYRPTGCVAPSIMLVFHGNGRTAESYRDSAQAFADRTCFVVYAPLFDEERFPNWSYHRGGVARVGELLPVEEWTVELVDDLIAWSRTQEGRPDAPVFLFGHSAGAQFLSRVAAYSLPSDVERIVLANPSTYVMPSLDEEAPYGFGLLPDGEAEDHLRGYLAAPVTVFLGLDDTGDEDLTMTAEAQRQGENRLDRGRKVFEEAHRVAEDNGWPFGWQLVHADDVGHSARGMLAAPEMIQALGF